MVSRLSRRSMLALSMASSAIWLSGCAASRSARVPNSFAWFDLVTNDVAASRDFYAGMFGWTYGQQQSDGVLPVIGNGEELGGIYTAADVGVDPEFSSQWVPILSVADVPRTYATALKNGGKKLREPFSAQGSTYAAIRDPRGAVLVLYDGSEGFPLDGAQKPNTWSWADLLTDDQKKSRSFYGSVFGFKTQQQGGQTVLTSGGVVRGGMVNIGDSRVEPTWLPYVAVANVSDAVARSRELGGGPYAVSDDAAVLLDRTGAAIGVKQV